jgi:hypothetical protein
MDLWRTRLWASASAWECQDWASASRHTESVHRWVHASHGSSASARAEPGSPADSARSTHPARSAPVLADPPRPGAHRAPAQHHHHPRSSSEPDGRQNARRTRPNATHGPIAREGLRSVNTVRPKDRCPRGRPACAAGAWRVVPCRGDQLGRDVQTALSRVRPASAGMSRPSARPKRLMGAEDPAVVGQWRAVDDLYTDDRAQRDHVVAATDQIGQIASHPTQRSVQAG